MAEVTERKRDRVARRQVDKFAERRAELAAAALQTLAEFGYARTSLRDIAQNSNFSHGVLHYYFRDKIDLITYCVRQYKAECVTKYDNIVATATSPEELRRGIGAIMAATLREDAQLHRLWYDLRNQSLFDDSFRKDVREIDQSLERMIWRIVSRYAELARATLSVSPSVAYAIFDGLFRLALIRHLDGSESAPVELQATTESIIQSLVSLGWPSSAVRSQIAQAITVQLKRAVSELPDDEALRLLTRGRGLIARGMGRMLIYQLGLALRDAGTSPADARLAELESQLRIGMNSATPAEAAVTARRQPGHSDPEPGRQPRIAR